LWWTKWSAKIQPRLSALLRWKLRFKRLSDLVFCVWKIIAGCLGQRPSGHFWGVAPGT
jgi:hypothetical protein